MFERGGIKITFRFDTVSSCFKYADGDNPLSHTHIAFPGSIHVETESKYNLSNTSNYGTIRQGITMTHSLILDLINIRCSLKHNNDKHDKYIIKIIYPYFCCNRCLSLIFSNFSLCFLSFVLDRCVFIKVHLSHFENLLR